MLTRKMQRTRNNNNENEDDTDLFQTKTGTSNEDLTIHTTKINMHIFDKLNGSQSETSRSSVQYIRPNKLNITRGEIAKKGHNLS